MKRKTAAQLLELMKAKTRIEKYAFEEVKHESDQKLERASSLRAAAIEQSAEGGVKPDAAGIINAARFSSLRLAQARQERAEAAEMAPLIEARRKDIHNALRRELAMAHLSRQIETEERKAEGELEENRQEAVRTLRIIHPEE